MGGRNRIVVDYGDYEGLILIDVIDNETGFSDLQEYDDCAWPDKGKRQHIPSFDSGQVVDVPPGDEGFVYLWPEKNHRVKLKTPDYVALHRLVSNLNPKTIWEHLVNGGTKEELKRDLPEEFWAFIDETADEIENNAVDLLKEVYRVYGSIVGRPDWDEEAASNRKRFAMEALKHPHVKAYLFKVYDGKAIWTDCLRAVKPSSSSDRDEG